MFKPLIAAALIAAFAAPAALAGPAERLGRIDHRLTAAEVRGDFAQGSRADLAEDRLDRFRTRSTAAKAAGTRPMTMARAT